MWGMPTYTPHHRNHGRGVPAAINRLVRSLDAAVRGAKPASGNPFEAALNANGDMLKALADHAITLGPLVRRHLIDGFDGVPEGLTLGWAQLPGKAGGSVLSLGAFTDRAHFSQIALADTQGRVFAGTDPAMDTHDMQPRFLFGKEGELKLPDGPRFGHQTSGASDAPRMLTVVQGGIVGRDDTGRLTWLASWLKTDNRYTLEQVRAALPASMRYDLEYRDAITIAFFAAYLLPQMRGPLIGFGSGNIFRRLNREAPIGAIRRCLRDTLDARAHGMRASGLEDHFADLMHEVRAPEPATGLDAVHGAEPLHLYTSTYSGNYFFTWDTELQIPAVLQTLRIEGNLNRFAAVSAWLERNARLGLNPTEDTVTRAQAAQIDWMLLHNPALIALKTNEHDETYAGALEGGATAGGVGAGLPTSDEGVHAILRMVDEARAQNRRIADKERGADSGARAGAGAGESDNAASHGSEWLYRQSMSTLLRRLRLPYRFDVEFRSNLDSGLVGVGFTTAGPSMMPTSRYDADTHAWKDLSADQRASMSAAYNLRVGLMMAAMAFGADDRIRQVSLHVDSIGLEEAVAEQNTAISGAVGQMMHMVERGQFGDVSLGGGKAAPKDGDFHGDPTRTPMPAMDDGDGGTAASDAGTTDASDDTGVVGTDGVVDAGNAANGSASGTSDDTAGSTASTSAEHGDSDMDTADKATVDSRFEDLMKDFDFDEVAFNMPQGNRATDTAATDIAGMAYGLGSTGDGADGLGVAAAAGSGDGGSADGDPLTALQTTPTVRTLATVTFTREALLERLREDGLEHPIDTYRMFDAVMEMDEHGALLPVNPGFDLRDNRFAPAGSQEEPELSDTVFEPHMARVLGAHDAVDLSIQRADLLQHGVAEFHRLAADPNLLSVAKAQRAMAIIDRIADPELSALAPRVTSALIDGEDTPDFDFQLTHDIERARLKARDLLFSGNAEQAFDMIEAELERLDLMYANNPGVPRYFNSYAERVVYNRLFATSGEQTVLIPDDLFYAHMELADVLSQIKGPKEALPHLNAMVAYAPAYPLSHLKLAVQLARTEDWDLARAACLNALRVALDRDDAAFAYYRLAYAEWMRDRFDVAVAAYIMSDHISPGQIGALEGELHELVARADSQCVPVPDSVEAAKAVLMAHDLPVWPNTEVAAIMREAARVTVDEGMFVPARTLSVACARMNDDDSDGIDVVQAQFLRSLNA